MAVSIETSRLLLRRFTLDDAPAYHPLVSLPEVIRYTGEQAQQSLDEVRQVLLTRPLRDYTVHGFGRMACIERETGRLVGFCGLKYLEDLQEVDIGYRFLPETWGKGYATESCEAVLAQADKATLKKVIGLVEPENKASVRVLTKIGLLFERKIELPDHSGELDLYVRRMA